MINPVINKLSEIYQRESEEDSGKKYFIDKSKIHGQGVHAKKWLDKELRVGKVTSPYPNITPMGSKLNHSSKPNCRMERCGDCHDLITNKDISPREELTVDYSKYDEFKDPDPSWK